MLQNRKPKSIKLGYHKPSNRWYFRYSYGTERYEKDGEIKYKHHKTDEYVKNLEYHANPSNPVERKQNKDAEQWLNDRLQDMCSQLRNNTYKVIDRKQSESNMLDDLEYYANNSGYKPKTISAHKSVIRYLKLFTDGDFIPYTSIDEQFCIDFLGYLKNTYKTNGTPLSSNSVEGYFNKFKKFLGTKKKLFVEFPAADVFAEKGKTKKKVSLTQDEVRAMMLAPCKVPSVKKFFLFSCFSGQAFAECEKLRWSDLYKRSDGIWCIDGKRIKTNSDYQVPLNDAAMGIIGEPPKGYNVGRVFPHLKYHIANLEHLRSSARIAGIHKHLTFHVARHTFSRMFYEMNKDVIALMEILDHKDISTTQRYLTSLLGKNYDKPKPHIGNFNTANINWGLHPDDEE